MTNLDRWLAPLRGPGKRVWEWLERLGPLLAFFVVVEGAFKASHFLFGETTDVFYLAWIKRNLAWFVHRVGVSGHTLGPELSGVVECCHPRCSGIFPAGDPDDLEGHRSTATNGDDR